MIETLTWALANCSWTDEERGLLERQLAELKQ